MFYEFPANLTLEEVTSVIEEHNANLGVQAFLRVEKPGYIVFNYFVSFDGTFPPISQDDPVLARKQAILRECRGLTFSPSTGKVIARKYHKFFNVGQRFETQPSVIGWTAPHVIMSKLDGSMITPFRPDGSDTIRWGTKMGLTDVAKPVEDFVLNHPEYDEFARDCEDSHVTPIFEWTSRKQRIVIDYPEDRLVLTAIREWNRGYYDTIDGLTAMAAPFGIPVVDIRPGSVEDIDDLIKETADLIGEEGYVIRFENGHMVKLKAREYCLIHGTKDHLCAEKPVLNTIFADAMDDIIPFMDADDKVRIDRFMANLEKAIAATAADMTALAASMKALSGGSRKTFALEHAQGLDQVQRALCFGLWDGGDAVSQVKKIIASSLGSGPRIDTVRHLFGGLRWDDYRDTNVVLDD